MDNLPQQSNHTGEGELNNYVQQQIPPMVNSLPQIIPNNTQQQSQQQQQQQSSQQHQLNSVPVMGTLQTVLTQGLNQSQHSQSQHNQSHNQSHSQSHNHTSASSSPAHEHQTQMLTRMRLQDLVREVDPNEQLDEDVEEVLLQMADDFVDSAITAACLLAKHRKSNTVEVKDLQLHLERNWNMWIPGFGTDELRPYKRSTVTEAHKQRLTLIRKTLKKY